jgi:RimJ/RimL family protein N-acetyltransferase
VTLTDGEIVLRPFTEEDVPAITAACQDPEIPRWTSVPAPYTEEDARTFVSGAGEGSFAIVDAQTGEFLGEISLRWVDANVQVGYLVKREARGHGVATRALLILSRWAVEELGSGRVQLITDPENVASQRVAERAGFTREATLRSYFELKGRRRDAVIAPARRARVALPTETGSDLSQSSSPRDYDQERRA